MSEHDCLGDHFKEKIRELESQLSKCEARVEKYREVLKELELRPYEDSDLASLLETLSVRAKQALEEGEDGK